MVCVRRPPAASAPRRRIRTIAIGLQIGLSVLLLSGAGLFVRTLHQLKGQNLGMSTDHVVLFALDPTMSGYAPTATSLAVSRTCPAQSLASLSRASRPSEGSTDPVLSGSESIVQHLRRRLHPAPRGRHRHGDAAYHTAATSTLSASSSSRAADLTEADRAGAAPRSPSSHEALPTKFFGSPEKALGHHG